MADIGEHIAFPVRYDARDEQVRDVDGDIVAVMSVSQRMAHRDIIGEYIAAALNEKHQRDMAGTICTNCGLPGEAPWKPCKPEFDHDWAVVEKGGPDD